MEMHALQATSKTAETQALRALHLGRPAGDAEATCQAEQWRPVVGYEGIYSVSDRGRVKRDKATLAWPPGKILKPNAIQTGYLQYPLNADGREVRRLAHRLVAEAFIGPAPKGRPHVNHKNGIRTDNRPANLEWCSPAENVRHAREVLGWNPRHGNNPRGEKHYNCKLTNAQVAEIKAKRSAGVLEREIVAEYGITRMTVYRIMAGKTRVAG